MKQVRNIFFVVLAVIGSQNIFAQTNLFYGGHEEDIANSIVQFENNFYILGTTRKDNKSSSDFYVLQLYNNGSIKNEFIFGGIHADIGKHILVDKSGIFVFGKKWDGGYSRNDMYLTKLNFKGEIQWEKYYGGWHNDLGHKFIKTNDGGFAMVGFNRSLDDFGDVYLAKADKAGELLWQNNFGSRYVDNGFDVIETSNGDYIIAGTLGGFYNPTSTDYLNHDADIYLIKTNSSGEEIWSKTYGGDQHDWAKEIIKAPGGGYFICGSTQSQGRGSFDIFLMKIDDDGNEIWFKTFGGTDFDYGESVRISTDQKILILGTSASYSENLRPDHMVIKTNLDGEIIWSNTFGGEGSDYSTALECISDSGCVFTGWTDKGQSGKKDIVFYKLSKNGFTSSISTIPQINDSIEQIQVYPNPVKDNLQVYINTKITDTFLLDIVNVRGAAVYKSNAQPNILNTFQPNLAPGIYILTIKNDNKIVLNQKLVIQ